MNYQLRSARPADAEAITELFLAARRDAMPYLPELHSDRETRHWVEHQVLASGGVTVAERSGEILGFSALRGDHLDHLYVAPGVQGLGIGSVLLGRLKKDSGHSLSLYVFQKNKRARAFYEKHGFTCAAFGDGSANEENEPDAIYILTEALAK